MSNRIPIRYSKTWSWLLLSTFLPPSSAYIEVDGDNVDVHMGYAFHSRFTRSDVRTVTENSSVVSVGVHGWNGRWLVNGASSPIARIELAAPVPGRVVGFRIRLRELLVSVDDVAQLQRALLT